MNPEKLAQKLGKKEKDDEPNITQAQLQEEMCRVLDEGWSDILGNGPDTAFDCDFRIYRRPGESPMLFQFERNNSGNFDATRVDEQIIAGRLSEFSSWFQYHLPKAHLTHRASLEVVRAWAARTTLKRLEEPPKPVAFKSQPAVCLAENRLDFDPVVDDFDLYTAAPIFAKTLDRIKTNRDSFIYRIGSLFDENADRKQAIWLWGQKDAGKSFLERFIRSLCGMGATMSVDPEDLNDNHWKEPFVGKRALFFQEASTGFIQSAKFKKLTGDLYHSINPKGEKKFTAPLPVMLFFFSNKAPEISSDPALLERIIDCEIEPVPREDMVPGHEMDNVFEKERPYIVGYCIKKYQEAVVPGARLPAEKGSLERLSDIHELEWFEWANMRFQPCPHSLVLGQEVEIAARASGYNKRDLGKIYNVLNRKWGVQKDRRYFGDSLHSVQRRIWAGLKWSRGYREKYGNYEAPDKMGAQIIPIKEPKDYAYDGSDEQVPMGDGELF